MASVILSYTNKCDTIVLYLVSLNLQTFFSKAKSKSFERHIWDYNNGDYELLREKASEYDWNSLYDDNIDIYVEYIYIYIKKQQQKKNRKKKKKKKKKKKNKKKKQKKKKKKRNPLYN